MMGNEKGSRMKQNFFQMSKNFPVNFVSASNYINYIFVLVKFIERELYFQLLEYLT